MVVDIVSLNLNEDDRLAALHEYCLLDQPSDDELSAVVRVAVAAGRMVGFATVRPAYDGVPAHLAAIYTRGTYWGTGL